MQDQYIVFTVGASSCTGSLAPVVIQAVIEPDDRAEEIRKHDLNTWYRTGKKKRERKPRQNFRQR